MRGEDRTSGAKERGRGRGARKLEGGMVMRTKLIAWLSLVLAGCVGVNPEWDDPVAATAWVPESRCDAGTGDDGGEDDDDEDRSASGEDDAGSDACGVVENEACGEGLVACASAGGWFCADLREHDEHCGECFNDCFAYGDASCVEGECYCWGGPWWKLCGEGCADTRMDPTGCGVECVDCRVEYGEDARCESGICKPGKGGPASQG